jgi:hypothetical protein
MTVLRRLDAAQEPTKDAVWFRDARSWIWPHMAKWETIRNDRAWRNANQIRQACTTAS